MKNFLLSLFVFVFFLEPAIVYAQSDYVLPYPSTMPGTIWYKAHRVLELFQKYWYFGSFAQFTYNLKQSDKYLVEAKTLFEYKQYLLGHEALLRSNEYFQKIPRNLIEAEREKKNIKMKAAVFRDAALKHQEVLAEMLGDVPVKINWQPENDMPTTLYLQESIKHSIRLRNNI